MRSDMLLALTGALATALVWLMVGTAHAAEGEPGSFTWTPSLKVASIVNDNVDHEKGDGDGAVGMRVRPRLELAYRIMGLELGADLGVDIQQYSQADNQASDQFYRAIGWGPALAPRCNQQVVLYSERLFRMLHVSSGHYSRAAFVQATLMLREVDHFDVRIAPIGQSLKIIKFSASMSAPSCSGTKRSTGRMCGRLTPARSSRYACAQDD